MSTSITIHNIDDSTASWMHHAAEIQGVKDEAAIFTLLHKVIRQNINVADLPEYHDLDHLAGTWTEEEAEEFLRYAAAFNQIEPHLWQGECEHENCDAH